MVDRVIRVQVLEVLNFELGTDVRQPMSKPFLFLEGPFFKPIGTFCHVNWDA